MKLNPKNKSTMFIARPMIIATPIIVGYSLYYYMYLSHIKNKKDIFCYI